MNFKFEFNEQEINLVLKALTKLPFEEVYKLIHKIEKDANEQIKKEKNE